MTFPFRKHPFFTALLLAVMVSLSSSQAQGPAQPLVTLDSGAIVQLCADCSPREIRLAVTPRHGLRVKTSTKAQENPEVIEVSFGNLRDGSLVPSFVPRWELTPSGVPTALVVRVDPKIRKAGNYDILLSLQPKSMPEAPRLKIQLIHPAAKLELPEKLLVNRTVYWPFVTDTDKMTLDIREASGSSEVTDSTIQTRASMAGADMVTGRVLVTGVDPKTTLVAAGQTRNLEYDMAGDFPLGTVTGSMQFFAPELPDPATLNFEVRSKLSKFYILFAILLGLFLSWLLKVYLHNQIELADARSKAGSLLDRVQDDFNTHSDHEFRDLLRQRLEELRRAMANDDTADITQRITALDQAWRDALQGYASRLQNAHTALDDLRKITDNVWIVPGPVLETLAGAKQAHAGMLDTNHIQQQLARNDASGALTAAAALRAQLAGRLRDLGSTWHSDLRSYLDSLAGAQAGLPAPVTDQLAAALEKDEQGLSRMNIEQLLPDAPVAALIQFLRDFEAEYRIAKELLRQLSLRLRQELTAFLQALNVSADEIDADEPLQILEERLYSFARDLEQTAADPRTAADGLEQGLNELQGAWREAILRQPPEKVQADIQDLVRQRDFVIAAEYIAAARAAAVGHRSLGEGEEEEPEQQLVPSWPGQAGLWPVSALTILSSSSQPARMPDAVSGLHFRSLRKTRTAKAAQTFIVGTLLVVWAFHASSQNFGGTWSDMTTIFFTAFGLDVTVDALWTKIQPKTG